jgi:hypothetical protein
VDEESGAGEMDHLREQALRSALRAVNEPPTLWRLNGCGTTMMGRYYDPEMAPTQFYSLVWFTFILIPISPMGIYLVSQSRGSYRFYGAIEKEDFNALYRYGYLKLIWNGLMETAVVFGAVFLIFGIGWFFLRR